jgi:hypothetical protein
MKSAFGMTTKTFDEATGRFQTAMVSPWRSIWATLWARDREARRISPGGLFGRLVIFGVFGGYGIVLLRSPRTRYDGFLLIIVSVVTIVSSVRRHRETLLEGINAVARSFSLLLKRFSLFFKR